MSNGQYTNSVIGETPDDADQTKSVSGPRVITLGPLTLIIWYVTINSTTVVIKMHVIHITSHPISTYWEYTTSIMVRVARR